jgi:hypothetical protein
MPAIFDLLYREYCQSRLTEMRKQLFIWRESREVSGTNCDVDRTDGAIGTFPVPAEPAGRGNPPIAAEPACPPRANEAAGGVKTMNNAITTFTKVLDMSSATMIHWNGEAIRLT